MTARLPRPAMRGVRALLLWFFLLAAQKKEDLLNKN